MTGHIVSLLDFQETRNHHVHLVSDYNEVLDTTPREHIPWIDSIYVQLTNN